jgi:magnesium transporter
MKQSKEVNRIISWAVTLFAPTLVGTVYGVNFEHMPELSWPGGYPFALSLTVAMGIGLYVALKRRKWF